MEPYTQHGGLPAEQRCRYIFRYYNYNEKGSNNNFEANSVVNQSMNFEKFKFDY